MRQNRFAHLIIITVIAVLGVIGYFGYKNVLPKTYVSTNPVSDQTSNADISGWKTYTNDKIGFSYRYSIG